MRSRIIHQIVLAGASVVLAACSAEPISAPHAASTAARRDLIIVRETGARASILDSSAARTVATVATTDGGEVTFLDLGDDIGIAEVAAVDRPFLAGPLIEYAGATPLEVYRALSPRSDEAPGALLRHHQMLRGTQDVPRVLAPEGIVALGITTPGVEAYASCHTRWPTIWKNAFANLTRYQAAAFYRPAARATIYTFYPGSNVYNGTSPNSRTYLGVCSSEEIYDNDLSVYIERRISNNWLLVHEYLLNEGRKFTFHSGVPAYYRGRAYVWMSYNGGIGLGAAWTIAPGLAP